MKSDEMRQIKKAKKTKHRMKSTIAILILWAITRSHKTLGPGKRNSVQNSRNDRFSVQPDDNLETEQKSHRNTTTKTRENSFSKILDSNFGPKKKTNNKNIPHKKKNLEMATAKAEI